MKSHSKSKRPVSGRWLLPSLLICTFGCGPRAEIREYTVDAGTDPIVNSDLLKSEFPVIPFSWDVPESWVMASNDQFSTVAWEAGTKPEIGRITVSDVSMGMGLNAQLTRWRGQIGVELSNSDDPMTGTEQLQLDGTAATYCDFQGEEQTIMGMMFSRGEKLWVFKFKGDNAVADAQRKRFRGFCESVKVTDE